MDVLLIGFGVLLILVGIVGCFIPVLPGPPLAYISILLLQASSKSPYSLKFILILGGIVVVVTLVDYLVPSLGAKKWGGSKYGMIGAMIGVVLGLFFIPPFGFLIFPLLGALVGEIIYGAETKTAFKSALGTLAGLLFGTVLKLSLTGVIAYYFFSEL